MTIDIIEATQYRSHCMTAKLVTARKSHACDYSRDTSWARGCQTIRPGDRYVRVTVFPGDRYVRVTVFPGDRYVRVTVFPGHDFIDAARPERGACCLGCAEGYTGLDELARSATR